jgi:hypothetical protein
LLYYHFSFTFPFQFQLVFIKLSRWQWCKCTYPSIIFKRIPIFKAIILYLPIKLSKSPQQDMTCMHWNHITHNLINILSNKKQDQDLLGHFHLTTIIQQLQSIRSIMLNCTQVHFTNKDSTGYISTTSTIYNKTTHLALYMATCIKDVLP